MIKAEELRKMRESSVNEVLEEIEQRILMAAKMGSISMSYYWTKKRLPETDKEYVIKFLREHGYEVTRHKGGDQRDGDYDYMAIFWK